MGTSIPELRNFLYEAVYQVPDKPILPKHIIDSPEISVYIDNFGRKHDYCFVANWQGKLVGALGKEPGVNGEMAGYGNIDDGTPEFAISLYSEFRNKGIGTQLMERMIEHLKHKQYSNASLSVHKENYAIKMYKSVGFEVMEERDDDYLMVTLL